MRHVALPTGTKNADDAHLEEHFVVVVDEERAGAEFLHVGVIQRGRRRQGTTAMGEPKKTKCSAFKNPELSIRDLIRRSIPGLGAVVGRVRL